jgi:outer membrane protein assembly factor BamB
VLIPLVVVVLAAAAVGARVLLGDGVSGPYGPFPRALAARPPARAPQRVATVTEPPSMAQVYGGVAINGFAQIFGGADMHTRAVDIATGRTYWEYAKEKRSEPIGLDQRTGDVYVDGNDYLSRIHVRTGAVVWSRKAYGGFPLERAIVTGSVVVLVADDEDGHMTVRGLDPATGGTRWNADYSCDALRRTTAVAGGTLVIGCGNDGALHGVDLATGRGLWDEKLTRLLPGTSLGDREKTAALDAGGGRAAVATGGAYTLLDPATGAVVRHRATKGQWTLAFSGGTRISECLDGKSLGLCANDTASGKPLWTTPAAPAERGATVSDFGQSARVAAIADGRFYTSLGTDVLHEFDLRTGEQVTQWRLGFRIRDNPAPVTVSGGTVVVREGLVGVAAEVYADRPDLARTRDLTMAQ